jgi:FkbH-like protein
MPIKSLMSWREPRSTDWRDEAKRITSALKAGDRTIGVAQRIRRLGSMRLDDGERLQLRRIVKLARELAEPLPEYRLYRLLVVSNRTTNFFAADLEAAGTARGLLIETVDAGYDNVEALAFNAQSELPSGRFDAVLLMLDGGFFPASGSFLDIEAEADAITAACERLNRIVSGLRARCAAPVIVATVAFGAEGQLSSADPSMPGTAPRLTMAINQAIADGAARGHLVPFDLVSLANRIGASVFSDPARFNQAKIPFSLDASPVIADGLAAVIAGMTGRAGRVLVLDLDNTVWGGIVADDGIERIEIGQGSASGEAFLAVQRYALELRRRGIVLAVCSKNLDDVARGPFKAHPDMLVREEHIAVFVANFEDKATNLARIAQTLDLDPSALVFLDDNPAERERVRSALPFVMVPEVGDDAALYVRSLVYSGYFEHSRLSADDLQRADTYTARSAAKTLQATISDYDEYLKSLEMELSITPFDPMGRARISQLIQKSNQFNLTTKRYSEIDVGEIETDVTRVGWQVRLKDRFADHGIISVVIADKGATAWSIDTWVMSCRVLQRRVEETIMAKLAGTAAAAGATELLGTYIPTTRNKLVETFFERQGFAHQNTDGGTKRYRLDLTTAKFDTSALIAVVP